MVTPAELHVPRYGEAALADLVPSLFAAMGIAGFDDVLGLEPLGSTCLLLLDGLGWELLRRHPTEAPFLFGLTASASPLTAGFPATTAASLASIGTGLPPGEHGFVGFTLAIPGEDRAMDCLRWQVYGANPPINLHDRIAPEQMQPVATAFERAVAADGDVVLIGPPAFATDAFTRAALRGGRYRPAVSMGDLVAGVAETLHTPGRRFIYAYHGDLDTTGHVRGVASEAWRLQLGHIDRLCATLAERLPSGAALVITADHGMVDLQADERIDVADVPALMDGVRLLAGEPRARYVHTRPGAAADVRAAWHATLGDRMWILTREEAIATGWFGLRVADYVRPRIGDVVAVAHGPVGVVQRAVGPLHARLIGNHGSVTPPEQLVPFLVVRG